MAWNFSISQNYFVGYLTKKVKGGQFAPLEIQKMTFDKCGTGKMKKICWNLWHITNIRKRPDKIPLPLDVEQYYTCSLKSYSFAGGTNTVDL
jgi:hypothetical protein